MGQKQSYTLNDPNRQSTNSDEVAYDISIPDKSSQKINFRHLDSPSAVPATAKTQATAKELSQLEQGSSSIDTSKASVAEVKILGPTKELEDCERPHPKAQAEPTFTTFVQPTYDEDIVPTQDLTDNDMKLNNISQQKEKENQMEPEKWQPVDTTKEKNVNDIVFHSHRSSSAEDEDKFEECECHEQQQEQRQQQLQQQLQQQEQRQAQIGKQLHEQHRQQEKIIQHAVEEQQQQYPQDHPQDQQQHTQVYQKQQEQEVKEQKTGDSACGWVFSSEAPRPPPPYPQSEERIESMLVHTDDASKSERENGGNNANLSAADILAENVTQYSPNELTAAALNLTPQTKKVAKAPPIPCEDGYGDSSSSDEAAAVGKVVAFAHSDASFLDHAKHVNHSAYDNEQNNNAQNGIVVESYVRKIDISSNYNDNDNAQSHRVFRQ